MHPRHILKADDFDWLTMLKLFELAETMRDMLKRSDGRRWLNKVFTRRVVNLLFDQPSTRTLNSFSMAARHLGMEAVEERNARQFSSQAKGESLAHTMRTLSGYQPDLFVVRRNSLQAGEIAEAARFVDVPVINAGEGSFEHPTQALLDAYTIWREFRHRLELVIGWGGDLDKGRTIHSGIKVMTMPRCPWKVRMLGISPEAMRLPLEYRQHLERSGVEFRECFDPEDMMITFPDADVWYWTRCQLEHQQDESVRLALLEKASTYAVHREHLQVMQGHAILMHPLPIDQNILEVDNEVSEWGMRPVANRPQPFEKVRIFEQSDNGLWVRMALIFWVIKGHFDVLEASWA